MQEVEVQEELLGSEETAMQEDLRPVRCAAAVAAATVRGSRSMWLPLRSKHQGLVSFGLPAHCKMLPWP